MTSLVLNNWAQVCCQFIIIIGLKNGLTEGKCILRCADGPNRHFSYTHEYTFFDTDHTMIDEKI